MTADRFAARRAALSRACPGWAFILPARPALRHGRIDAPRTRPDGDLMYLSGVGEAGACLIVRPDGRAVLYAEAPDARLDRWNGPRPTLDDLAVRSAADDVRPIAALFDDLPDHLNMATTLGYRSGRPDGLDAPILSALHAHSRGPGDRVLLPIHDPSGPIGELRVIKDTTELTQMREAAAITCDAHLELMRHASQGDSALALAGRFDAACRRAGSGQQSYPSIVGIGPDATVLHATPGRRRLGPDDLVLIDAAAASTYACDVTRTWPATAFGAKSVLYEAVLAAQEAAIAAVRPGANLADVHHAAVSILADRCAGLQLSGPVERWFPHTTSHWIGLDTHDPGSTTRDGQPRPLEPGMTFTVEPGLYVDIDDPEAPSHLRGAGIRIEDTVLVTANGVEVLTSAVPKGLDALEALRDERS